MASALAEGRDARVERKNLGLHNGQVRTQPCAAVNATWYLDGVRLGKGDLGTADLIRISRRLKGTGHTFVALLTARIREYATFQENLEGCARYIVNRHRIYSVHAGFNPRTERRVMDSGPCISRISPGEIEQVVDYGVPEAP